MEGTGYTAGKSPVFVALEDTGGESSSGRRVGARLRYPGETRGRLRLVFLPRSSAGSRFTPAHIRPASNAAVLDSGVPIRRTWERAACVPVGTGHCERIR